MGNPTTMQRVSIAQFQNNQQIETRLLISGKALLPYKSGGEEKLRLRVDFMDRTGTISGNVWDNAEKIYEAFEVGDIVLVKAVANEYRGTLGLNIRFMSLVPEGEDGPGNYLPATEADVGELYAAIKMWISEVKDDALRNMLEYIFVHSPYARRFVEAIGAVNHHHAYIGGLLEHTHRVTWLTRAFVKSYGLDKEDEHVFDVATAAGLLHDIGKTMGYEWKSGFSYSEEGVLLDHIVIGIQILERIFTLPAKDGSGPMFPLDGDVKMRLMHAIASHHGKLEYGSPVPPQTPEAIALHMADMVDSRMNKVSAAVKKSAGQRWMSEAQRFTTDRNVRLFFGGEE